MREENFSERRGKEHSVDKILLTFHKLSLSIAFKYFVQENFSSHQCCIVYGSLLF